MGSRGRYARARYGLRPFVLDFFCVVPLDCVFEAPITALGDKRGWARSKTLCARLTPLGETLSIGQMGCFHIRLVVPGLGY